MMNADQHQQLLNVVKNQNTNELINQSPATPSFDIKATKQNDNNSNIENS